MKDTCVVMPDWDSVCTFRAGLSWCAVSSISNRLHKGSQGTYSILPCSLLCYLWKSANNARCITCSQMFAGPEANDFRVSSNSTSSTNEWTVLEALEYYPVVQGYNISYREKDFEKESKSVFGLSQHEANAVALFTCTPFTSVATRLYDSILQYKSLYGFHCCLCLLGVDYILLVWQIHSSCEGEFGK